MPKVDAPQERLYGPLARGFGRRLEQAVGSIGEKVKAASAMGLSVDQLGRILDERAVPNFASIAALAGVSGYSLDWLAFATGDVSKRNFSTRTLSSADEDGVARIVGLDSLDWYKVPHHFVPPKTPLETLGAMKAPGAAMEPTIKRNDLLLVDLSITGAGDGEIFVFDFSGDRVVRRTQRQPDGSMLLRADNPKFDTLLYSERSAPNAKVIGRVVWCGGPL